MVLFQAQRLRELCQHFDNWRLTPDSKSGIADRDGAVYSRGSFQQMAETINSNGGCHAPLALRYRIPTFSPYGTVCCACAEATTHDIFQYYICCSLFPEISALAAMSGLFLRTVAAVAQHDSSYDDSAVISMLFLLSVLQNSSC